MVSLTFSKEGEPDILTRFRSMCVGGNLHAKRSSNIKV